MLWSNGIARVQTSSVDRRSPRQGREASSCLLSPSVHTRPWSLGSHMHSWWPLSPGRCPWGSTDGWWRLLVAQSCLTLCNPMDCSPPGSSVHGILQARTLEWGSLSLLKGIFPTQRSSTGLLHCRRILYCLGLQGSSDSTPRTQIQYARCSEEVAKISDSKVRFWIPDLSPTHAWPWSCSILSEFQILQLKMRIYIHLKLLIYHITMYKADN